MWPRPPLCLAALLLFTRELQVSSSPVQLSVSVGDSVSLPCDGAAAAGIPEEKMHIKWKTSRPVLDSIYGRAYPGQGFEDRAEVSREKIRQGDFSLTIKSTLLSDEGLYDCYYRGRDIMEFLGNVKLTVTSRIESVSVPAGGDLSLPLYTREPVELLFGGTVLFPQSPEPRMAKLVAGPDEPGPGDELRVSVWGESLIVRSLTAADQGQYTVRDNRTKRAISTVSVSVSEEDPSPSASSPAAAAVTLGVILAVTAVCTVTTLIMCLKRKTVLKTLGLRRYPGNETKEAQYTEANSLH
ncbi:T-lymphocyte activation antigen CD80 [Amia ocellicauda]|uniref:T-lymphocyte activation antigen CD80 n=1 Tax=Amia ocellicauda TaxID=2972642 RepID=UPI0034647AA8